MRDTIELWLIVEANFERVYNGFKDQKGLCNVLNQLCIRENKLVWAELVLLKQIIQDYKKARNVSFNNIYIWDKEATKPRKMFIQKQILKELRK